MPHPYLFRSLELAPQAIRRLVEQIDSARFDEKLDLQRFSMREVVAHLADWEPIWLERFQKAVSLPGSTIMAYDEGQFAIERNYAASNPFDQVQRYIEARKTVVEFLKSLKPEHWKIRFIHPERGELSVEDLANMISGHDMYHIEQLTAYLGAKVAATW